MIVLADRYVYTAFGRDVARGVDTRLGARASTASRRGPISRSTSACRSTSRSQRILAGRAKLKYHEAGMDVGLAAIRPRASACSRARAGDLRRARCASSACEVIDATADINQQQQQVRRWCARCSAAIGKGERPCTTRIKLFYGHGLPVPEGRAAHGQPDRDRGHRRRRAIDADRSADAAGSRCRATPSCNTGWTRSPLLSETINEAKAGHELNVTTFSLLYAADFADRLENQIIPALRAGFIVIADRYMYTAFARNAVMGADAAVDARALRLRRRARPGPLSRDRRRALVPRVLEAKGMDYWESGHAPEARRATSSIPSVAIRRG